jgi:transposase
MNEITTIGLDVAKNVFHLVGFDSRGKERRKKVLRRGQVLTYFAQLPACVLGMEGCASAHYWGRELEKLGHTVRLVPAQHVKAYLRGNKNDYNDARAIAEAVNRPGLRFVKLKTSDQQDVQALHRLREGQIKQRTALGNRIRGLLAEFGVVLPQGIAVLRRRIPEVLEDAENGLSELFRELLAESYRELQALDARIAFYTRKVEQHGRQSEACRRLQSVPGFGPIVASVFAAQVDDGQGYRRGRDVAASIGLVPRQHSTGGKPRLLGISKRGDRYLRSLLIHGARAVVRQAEGKEDRLSRWINRLRAERGINRATVALANKMARMGWAILRYQSTYEPA